MMLDKTGVPNAEELERVFPSKERLLKGAVAVIECFQNIPCDPCYSACKRGAIEKFKDINDLPKIDTSKCNGCGLCISKCPGLAIMVVDITYSENEALIKIPYEFFPLPREGQIVKGVDREGNYIADVKVTKVLNTKVLDKTPIISVLVPRDLIKVIRNIQI